MGAIVKDVVCGMHTSTDSEFHTVHASTNYYFCSQHCQDKFSEDPQKYIEVKKWSSEKQKEKTNEHTDTLYLSYASRDPTKRTRHLS